MLPVWRRPLGGLHVDGERRTLARQGFWKWTSPALRQHDLVGAADHCWFSCMARDQAGTWSQVLPLFLSAASQRAGGETSTSRKRTLPAIHDQHVPGNESRSIGCEIHRCPLQVVLAAKPALGDGAQ